VNKRSLWAIFFIGVGLAAAPVYFRMFSRAPLGGEMIQQFRPFMNSGTISSFSDHLKSIDLAHSELSQPELASDFPQSSEFIHKWPEINNEMTDMLAVIERNFDNFSAVDALPPFPLFPWFFVLPGALLAGLALAGLRRVSSGRNVARLIAIIALVGLGLIAAPGIFKMFGRAPLGAQMIDDFGPLMTNTRVQSVQQYFLVIASTEAEVRNEVKPASGLSQSEWSIKFPGLAAFEQRWPKIANEMAPMVGAMSDNLDNFAAVDALPPFWLFPWFFVAPGVIVLIVAAAAFRTREISLISREIPVIPALLVLVLFACTTGKGSSSSSAGESLRGVLRFEPGTCSEAGVTRGSSFRMIQPSGTVEGGPFVTNGDSPCGDKTWTSLSPGSDTGITFGGFQSNPDPAFDAGGNGLADRLTQPQKWFAVAFSLSTNKKDPQTGLDVAAPTLRLEEGKVTGDLRAFSAAWNGQFFNQGSPKPDGSKPGNTTEVTGTYDSSSKKLRLSWASQIVGGPFNNFTGVWNFEGVLA
jgi:hypothetical protein